MLRWLKGLTRLRKIVTETLLRKEKFSSLPAKKTVAETDLRLGSKKIFLIDSTTFFLHSLAMIASHFTVKLPNIERKKLFLSLATPYDNISEL